MQVVRVPSGFKLEAQQMIQRIALQLNHGR
jgi:hypothetical protein